MFTKRFSVKAVLSFLFFFGVSGCDFEIRKKGNTDKDTPSANIPNEKAPASDDVKPGAANLTNFTLNVDDQAHASSSTDKQEYCKDKAIGYIAIGDDYVFACAGNLSSPGAFFLESNLLNENIEAIYTGVYTDSYDGVVDIGMVIIEVGKEYISGKCRSTEFSKYYRTFQPFGGNSVSRKSTEQLNSLTKDDGLCHSAKLKADNDFSTVILRALRNTGSQYGELKLTKIK